MKFDELLAMPIETGLLLMTGYACYLIAFVGRDGRHTGWDAVLIAGFFAIFARLLAPLVTLAAASTFGWNFSVLTASCIASILTLVVASLWRKYIQDAVAYILGKLGITWADRQVTAWQSIISTTKAKPTQIVVEMKDGRLLANFNLHPFNSHAPRSALGQDGSVAFYATHELAPGASEWKDTSWEGNGDFGDAITWIPADQVTKVMVRY